MTSIPFDYSFACRKCGEPVELNQSDLVDGTDEVNCPSCSAVNIVPGGLF